MEVVDNIKYTIFLHLAEKETINIHGYVHQINVNKSDTYCKNLRKRLIDDLHTSPQSLSMGCPVRKESRHFAAIIMSHTAIFSPPLSALFRKGNVKR